MGLLEYLQHEEYQNLYIEILLVRRRILPRKLLNDLTPDIANRLLVLYRMKAKAKERKWRENHKKNR